MLILLSTEDKTEKFSRITKIDLSLE